MDSKKKEKKKKTKKRNKLLSFDLLFFFLLYDWLSLSGRKLNSLHGGDNFSADI